jgi:hypothetical protein
MPTIEAGDVAPHDLREVSSFLRNLNGADIDVSAHPEVVNDLMSIAELDFDVTSYKKPEPVVVAPEEPTETQKLEHELLKSLIRGE